jgi:hypothetical protein
MQRPVTWSKIPRRRCGESTAKRISPRQLVTAFLVPVVFIGAVSRERKPLCARSHTRNVSLGYGPAPELRANHPPHQREAHWNVKVLVPSVLVTTLYEAT